jgi:hypothetical protein
VLTHINHRGAARPQRPLASYWRNPVTEALKHQAFRISASEGMVLVEAPGVVATLDVDAATLLSDQLLAACGSARLQQHAAIGQTPDPGPSSSG